MASNRKRICFVIQRYGRGIVGGAERLCAEYAQHLKPYYEVDVATTCAADYNTWKNSYLEGQTEEEGITVYRFSTDRPRDAKKLAALTKRVYDDPYHDMRTATEWLREVGPYSTELIRFIKEKRDCYDAFVFVGYHYYTATCGMPLVAGKSIFIPTAHDEEPLRKCNYFRYLFQIPRAVVYLTTEEKQFVQSFFENKRVANIVTGIGIEKWKKQELNADIIFRHALYSPYLIYTGRIDETKNCEKLVEYFIKYKQYYPSALKLVLVGKKMMDIPVRSDITYTGFVSEAEKFQLLSNAKVFIMPSENESLSISTLEAMRVGTPVLVNANSTVLKSHIEISNAGLYYYKQEDFIETLNTLVNNPGMAGAMGRNGEAYVDANYNWSNVEKELCRLIEGICNNDLYLV